MNLSKRTATRMLQNIEKQLMALAAEQQAMNNNVGGSANQMRKGGHVRQKMQTGNLVGDPWGLKGQTQIGSYGPTASFGFNQQQQQQQPFYGQNTTGQPLLQYQIPNSTYQQPSQQRPGYTPLPSAPQQQRVPYQQQQPFYGAPPVTPTASGTVARDTGPLRPPTGHLQMPTYGQLNPGQQMRGLAGTPQQPEQGTGTNWNNMMGMAPSIFNTIAGLTSGGADRLDPNQFQNPYESQAFGMMPDQFRVDDQLTDVRNQYANYIRNLRQTGNSRGEMMANMTSGMNRANEANTAIWAQKQNEENIMRTRKAGLRQEQGVRRAGINLQIRDMNDANRAAARNRRMSYLGAAATGAQTYGLTQELMKNQTASQNVWIDALKNMGPHWEQWLSLQGKGTNI